MAKLGIDEDSSESIYKAYSTLLICSSYFRLEDYNEAERYLNSIASFHFPLYKNMSTFLLLNSMKKEET